ncbi:unnamed protein product [Rhizophagus irregularis]|nr:unnamed protein product [Rhizophagus irregularis]CAB5382709.1 unnamed protein product [Rhizophagus irregularis]
MFIPSIFDAIEFIKMVSLLNSQYSPDKGEEENSDTECFEEIDNNEEEEEKEQEIEAKEIKKSKRRL